MNSGTKKEYQAGFTFIELLIVMIFLGIAVSSVVFIFKNQQVGNLELTAQGIASRLSDAQTKSAASIDGMAWGMHFENATNTATSGPFYAIFPGSSYLAASSTRFSLTHPVAYANLPQGSSTNVVFNKISGSVSSSFSVTINLATDSGKAKTISVSPQGKISVQ